MFKIFVLISLVAAVRAGILGAPALSAQPLALATPLAKTLTYAAPAIAKVAAPIAVDTDYDPNPSYSYAYEIQDHLTGDSKAQHETRQGDVVQGSYSLVEPDGTIRTVEYTADPHNGFNAVVHKQPVALAAPALTKVAAPLAYAAQPAHLALAAPTLTKLAPAPLAYAAQPAHLALAAPGLTNLAPAPLALAAHHAPLALAAPALHAAPLSLHTKALL